MSNTLSKEEVDVLSLLDEGNPYATYLNKSTLSTVQGWIDTGCYVLNGIISGRFKEGGIPKGRVTLLYGESMVGKSLFIQKILANAQKQGLIPVIFDSENAIDPEGAARLGLDTSRVKYVPIFNIEECRNQLYKFLTGVKERGMQGKFIVAIDSLANLESQLEQARMEKESTSADMGTRAKAVGSLLRTATQLSALTNTSIIASTHVYEDPAALHPTLIKNVPGGKKVVYLPSVSVQLMRKPLKENAQELKGVTEETAALQRNYVGVLIRALTAKNRFIKQYLEGDIYLSFKSGVDKYYGLLELAVALGVIVQTGSTYTFNGTKLGYAKNFAKDIKFWEGILTQIEEKAQEAWAYSSSNTPIEEDIYDEEEETE
jgi:recombination protein RecA